MILNPRGQDASFYRCQPVPMQRTQMKRPWWQGLNPKKGSFSSKLVKIPLLSMPDLRTAEPHAGPLIRQICSANSQPFAGSLVTLDPFPVIESSDSFKKESLRWIWVCLPWSQCLHQGHYSRAYKILDLPLWSPAQYWTSNWYNTASQHSTKRHSSWLRRHNKENMTATH